MSAVSTPIPPHRFAEAIVDLPLSNLYFKASEIRNSRAHLLSSNEQLRPYADEGGDADCAQAIEENKRTIQRIEERLLLLRIEVERRGSPWIGDEEVGSTEEGGPSADASDRADSNTRSPQRSPNGSAPAARSNVAERQAQEEDEGDPSGGVHL